MDLGVLQFPVYCFRSLTTYADAFIPMILSHKFRFIFLKTAKTAGTSIEIALSKHLGEEDIITPISAADETLRARCGFRGPQNYLLPIRQHSLREWPAAIFCGRRKKYYNHMSAAEVQALSGIDTWKSYYTFCFERNPFDRVISLYFWCCKREPRPALAEFLEGPEISLLSSRGSRLYRDHDGGIAVNRIGRYENLVTDLEEIRRVIGIPEPLELPFAKASHRQDKRHYREMIDEECRKKIELRFGEELQLFGYEF